MKEVPGDQDGLGPRGQHAINRGPEGVGDVGLALVDPERCLPVVLPEPEVDVREVRNLHRDNLGGRTAGRPYGE
jgi:hypothetical protein